MTKCAPIKVAVLLATYNGSSFIHEQIRSLKQNTTTFTVHWLDDHSTDDTVSVVRHATSQSGIPLVEWHQRMRKGLPGSYLRLLELVEADAYLFCDQDDIWQPGKIDATVKALSSDIDTPALVYSDPILIREKESVVLGRQSAQFGGSNALHLLDKYPPLVHPGAPGHTQGFTRVLRDILIDHVDVARYYACSHDCWMFTIAAMSGTCSLRQELPTALYRQHQSSFVNRLSQRSTSSVQLRWTQCQLYRRLVSRHAHGIVVASSKLPRGTGYDRLLGFAQSLAKLDRRQSILGTLDLLSPGPLHLNTSSRVWLAATCFTSSTNAQDPMQRIDGPAAPLPSSIVAGAE